MQIERTKIVITIIFVLLLSWSDIFSAGRIDLFGYPTQHTPYDQKWALREVLTARYRSFPHSGPQSIDKLFWRARRFTYRKENTNDEWQSPRATEEKQAGDCADKALWLYAQLRASGCQNVRLVVGKYRSVDEYFHVWLMRENENGSVDILDPTLQNRIWPLQTIGQGFYRPFFSFDGQQRYRHFD